MHNIGQNTHSNSRIRIAELEAKTAIEDCNLIVVEDNEDTKKSTVADLKKSFNGDGYPATDSKFYTTKKAQEFIQDLKREINTRADAKELETLVKRINSIIASSGDGTKDIELVDARNGKSTLSARLDYDISIAESKLMEKMKRTIKGKKVNIPYHYGYVDISIVRTRLPETAISTNKLVIRSRNLLDYSKIITIENQVSKVNRGFQYVQTTNGATSIEIPLPVIYPAGKYSLYSVVSFSSTFTDRVNIRLNVTHSDGTIESIPFNNEESFDFETKKGFNKLTIVYNNANRVEGASVTYKNIMLTNSYYIPVKYISYERNTRSLNIGDNIFEFYNNDYAYECDIQNGEVSITYHDNDISTEWIYNELIALREIIENKLDKCGMITDYGVYQFLDNMYVYSYEDGVKIEDSEEKFDRNGVHSKKITIAEKANRNSTMRIPLDAPVDIIETCGVFFYMDRPDYSLFTDTTGGLKIRLCSDDITNSAQTNYYEYIIHKKEMVQGWNFIKKRITEFKSYGSPDPNAIKYIHFEVCRTDEMNRKSVYLNCFVFNQKMKPTVLLCLNGTYDDSITYTYPYLRTRGIRPTIFLNSRRTLTPEAVDGILKYKLVDGWDIGLDGCHPNKEILTQDDNYRNQYMAIRNAHTWLTDLMVNTPISYSAAYGNLRPITANIIKDLGYKIVKTDSNGYCGFFSDKDLCLPMHLISNEIEVDDIIDKIDYAIESNQAVVLYTNDITEYGSEIDSKKVIFESIIDYIQEKIEDGSIECMTFSEFYNKCVN